MDLSVPISSDDHVLGDPDAAIVVVEYADLQCPYCARAHQALTELRGRLGERMCLVFRHLPLTHLHPLAPLAADTAEAAAAQGKFWEMHDALFEHQAQFGEGVIPVLAESMELDMEVLRADMESGRLRARVRKDAGDAAAMGLSQTPTFFINGERHHGDSDEASLVDAIMRFVS